MGRVARRIWAVAKNENPSQGAFIIEELTEQLEFERIAERCDVLPIIGVNTFRNPHGDPVSDKLELTRATDEEKQNQLKRLTDFHALHAHESPAMLRRLQQVVIEHSNVFEVLMAAVRVCSLGQITNALLGVGGQYRRNMSSTVAGERVDNPRRSPARDTCWYCPLTLYQAHPSHVGPWVGGGQLLINQG